MKDKFQPPRDLKNVVFEQLGAFGLAEVVGIAQDDRLVIVTHAHPEGGYWTMARFLFDLINAAYREGQREASQ